MLECPEDDDRERARRLFERALELPAQARAAFLARACDDAGMRRELEDLLRHNDEAEGFLTRGARLTEERPELPLGRVELPGYRLRRVLGRGGMGVVYLAEQESPRREVAIKLLRLDALDGASLGRIRREADILGRLDHPGIAHVLEAGTVATEHGALPWIAMEYVEGRPLGEHLEGRGDVRTLLRAFVELCDALQHAHLKGIVHRDLKPSNVLVDARGRVRVLDFGVARLIDEDAAESSFRTHSGQLVGTLAYASPEQVSGSSDLDARTDVYSLGVMLFELLTGELPYRVQDGRLLATIETILDVEPRRLSALRPDVPSDLEAIVGKALEKEPGRRYADAGELRADVQRLLDERPIVARRPSAAYQLRKFVRRNRVLSGSVAAVVVALLGAVLVLVSSRRSVHAQLVETSASLDFIAGEMFALTPVLGFGEDHRGTLEALEQKLAQQIERDPANRSLRASRARALYELGALDHARADFDSAWERQQLARALREELAADPDDLDSRRHLAQIHAKLGEAAWKRGDEATRDAWFQRALDQSEQLVRAHPEDVDLCQALGWSLERVGNLALERGDHETAVPLIERRLADALRLLDLDGDDWRVLFNAAHAHVMAAKACVRTGRPEEAYEHRKRCLELAQRLCRLQPRRVDFLWLHAGTSLSVAQMEARESPREAVPHLERSFALSTQLLANEPERYDFATLLGKSGALLTATTVRLGGDPVPILERWRAAAQVALGPSRELVLAHADLVAAAGDLVPGTDASATERGALERLRRALTEYPTYPVAVSFLREILGRASPEGREELCLGLQGQRPRLAAELARELGLRPPELAASGGH